MFSQVEGVLQKQTLWPFSCVCFVLIDIFWPRCLWACLILFRIVDYLFAIFFCSLALVGTVLFCCLALRTICFVSTNFDPCLLDTSCEQNKNKEGKQMRAGRTKSLDVPKESKKLTYYNMLKTCSSQIEKVNWEVLMHWVMTY